MKVKNNSTINKKEKKIVQKKNLVPYEELKKMVRNQGIKTSRDYRLLSKENEGMLNGWRIPSNPHVHYGYEWEGWGVFFGNRSLPLAPYKELKKILRDQRVKSAKDYQLLRKENEGVLNGWRISSNPNNIYKEWMGWGEFLGKKPFAPYEELKKAIRDQGIKKSKDYRLLRKESGGVH